MRISLYIGFILITISCTRQTNELKSSEADKLVIDSVAKKVGSIYNSLNSDSILIDCKAKTSLNFKDLVSSFGEPDTIIRHDKKTDFYGEPYSIVKFGNTEFRLFDNDIANVSKLNFDETNYKICYMGLTFDKGTTMEDLKMTFPMSYGAKDKISIADKQFTAIRFFTSNKPTDSQWIMLFHDNKLECLDYFDGND